MNIRFALLLAIFSCVLTVGLQRPGRAADELTDQVRAIFQEHCLECHGEEQNGGLRLDQLSTALRPTDSGKPAIVPGKASASRMIELLETPDEALRMPPDADPLSDREIDVLRRWIDAGAVADDAESEPGVGHWAYVSPSRRPPPRVSDNAMLQSPIDAFILARLESEGLGLSPLVDRPRLLRRLSLALIGVPPTPQQVEAFVEDESPEATETAIQALLNSPRFGERWARHWLDLARYADSNGFQADQLRDSWAYRDWVIRAFNDNMPFDQFVVEQLAGDLLPNPTLAQQIATGFHRTVPCNVEAGVHPEENRTNQVFDRVNTTGTVFLGTTIECAQCHNHKYDPFTQREYYQLFAFFNNTPLEVEKASGVRYDFIGPQLELPLRSEQQTRKEELQNELKQLRQERAALRNDRPYESWLAEVRAQAATPVQWQTLVPESASTTGGETTRVLEDGSLLVTGTLPGTSLYELRYQVPDGGLTAIRLDALTHDELPGQGPGRGDAVRSNFVLNELTLTIAAEDPDADPVSVPLHDAVADFSQSQWPVRGAIDGDRKTGWAIAPQFGKPHWAQFTLTQPLDAESAGRPLVLGLEQSWGRGRTLGRVLLSATQAEPDVLQLDPELRSAALADEPTKAQQETLRQHYATAHPKLKAIEKRIAAVEKDLNALKPDTTLVMVEMEQPRETHVLLRGNYLTPGPAVAPEVPEVLHDWPAELPRNRLGLARWLTDPQNPLLARVTVNRIWNELFGRGLVASPEDFGTRAEPPTHPHLLDWLAVEFVESGWNVKHLIELMVSSRAFQQSSSASERQLQVDPENRLYSRFPRFRHPAEMIRDRTLAAAGLLSDEMYGPPVMPYQPEGVWKAVGRNPPKWAAAKGDARFRRGVYVVWRRAAPYPSFVNFDAPDRAACVVNRPRTNTPLQALTLLNDLAYVEAALGLADRMLRDVPEGSLRERIEYGFRCVLTRRPAPHELDMLVGLAERAQTRFTDHPELAEQRVKRAKTIGVKVGSDETTDYAVYSVVGTVLFNLDEAITQE